MESAASQAGYTGRFKAPVEARDPDEQCARLSNKRTDREDDRPLAEALGRGRRVGRLTLNRKPQNFFAETEQIAFCVANVVPGIYFTNDPLLQGRLFSYLDTQLTRLGGPSFAQIPINRPVAPVHNHQQHGFGQQVIRPDARSIIPTASAADALFSQRRAKATCTTPSGLTATRSAPAATASS